MKLTWDLKVLAKDEKEFLKIIKELEGILPKSEQFLKTLSPTMSTKDFKELIDFSEKTKEKIRKIGAYLGLLSSEDTKSQKVMQLQPKIEQLSIKLADKSRPISHWIKGLEVEGKKPLDNKNAERLFKTLPDHYYSLMYSRKLAKHNLSQEVEKIIHRKDINGVDAITEVYDKVTTNFLYKFKVKGKEKVFDNQEELRKYTYSPKKEERKAAYDALFETYENNKETLFTLYAAIVKDWDQERELRKYKSAINMRNLSNSFEDPVIETMLNTCKKNKTIYQEFFKLKAEMLGMKKLARTDLLAPFEKKQKKYTFEETKKMVFDVFNTFHKDFATKSEILFKENHIDSHPRPSKRTGAFCMSVNSTIAPYVMLNFTETRRDISTMAHELGHAIHDLYSQELPLSVSHAPIPLCETASTFAEMLLFEELLKNSNKQEKIILLAEKIGDSYATIIRQAYFVDFEIQAHKAIPQGLSEEQLSDMYFKNLKEQFGDSIDLPKNFRYEWSYIPHIFHTPFYCYAYSFGDLLSLALYAQYKKQGKSFIPKLEIILKAGGSQDPVKLLNKEGFDITTEQFWQSGFDVVKSWLKELKKLNHSS
ncbi:M3 family oligoendopeptidase [archaeon]|jgi:oligoendopeptidase F|nr:M3 family oligoendopeptidase [archaeon]MBT4416779.1 M3 family oligoendopeptidase [archaeon]